MFDLNPMSDMSLHALAIDEPSHLPSLEAALNLAQFYRLSAAEARDVVAQVMDVVSTWRQTAVTVGIEGDQIEWMAPAFDPGPLAAR